MQNDKMESFDDEELEKLKKEENVAAMWELLENSYDGVDKDKEYRQKMRQNHVGEWITKEAAFEYQKRAIPLLAATNMQIVGEMKVLVHEVKEKYGLTELEAINIVCGNHIGDVIRKYDRIANDIPLISRKSSKSKDKTIKNEDA